MLNLISIALTSIFISNILLANFLGMCSFLECAKNIKTAMGLGLAVTFVLTITAPLNWIIYNGLLKEDAALWTLFGMTGINLEFIKFLTFISVIATFVQIVEMIIEKFSPALYSALGIFLPLITVNCAILGVSLFFVEEGHDFIQTTVFGFSSGIGWLMAILGLAAINQKMKYSNVPEGLRGLGITFIVTGLMSMAFMCFAGISL
ncbi:MAG: NADH:ubiquinone reductase (Na(+)-transporting) subunit E [Planctomycetes bacterium]|nr:NADH:ubiquinone reductase (Na(+)-transporting) subunit E [Planctomycetota bacterium]